MSFVLILAIFAVLMFLEIAYFKIANHFNILDKPNHRSSHKEITIRGGGIIFSIAVLLCPLIFGIQYPFFLAGLLIIALISFADDITPVNNLIRITFHLIAALLIIWQLNLFRLPLYFILLVIFLTIGIINAMNFMDGVNGITGIYGLVTLSVLYYLNQNILFTNSNYLLTIILAILVFNFFNCRKKAKCFAGDVGSVTLALIIVFFLLQLIVKTNNINYIFFLLVYGLDTATTIMFRLFRREKITEAHRSHFYQYIANEKKYPHLFVAILYGLSQLLINIAIVNYPDFNLVLFIFLLSITTLLFLTLRFLVEGKKRLLGSSAASI